MDWEAVGEETEGGKGRAKEWKGMKEGERRKKRESGFIPALLFSHFQSWAVSVSERLAKQLSKKISASFELTGQPVSGNFLLS